MPEKTITGSTQQRPKQHIPTLFLTRFWLAKTDPERHVARKLGVFDDNGLFFVKSYEHIHDYYLKKWLGKGPLIRMSEGMLYNDILLLTKRGEAFTIEEYADEHGLFKDTVTEMLDNLENVNLIHREVSTDGSGHMIIVVPHTPLPPEELKQVHAQLLARRNKQFIQKRRKEHGRNKRSWMVKAFSWKKLLKAFDNKISYAENFETVVGDITHKHIRDRYYSRSQFWEDVKEMCQRFKSKIKFPSDEPDERHQLLAFEIKEYIERIV